MDLAGKRVLVMGLGTFGGGVGAARFAVGCGAQVTVTDLAEKTSLSESIAALADVPIAAWKFGGHDQADFLSADVVVVNPAVRPGHPLLATAQQTGAELTSEIELFLEACPATVAAVTGSNGKSTTATMLAECLRRSGRRVWLGGNLGGSLLANVPDMRRDDIVVLELSSFQLHWLRTDGRPIADVGVVTNCTPNHLDWHSSWSSYTAAKRRLVAGPRAAGRVALNEVDPEVRTWLASVAAERRIPPRDESALPMLRVPGAHNRLNAELAVRAAIALGGAEEASLAALEEFAGLEHRMEFVGEKFGRRFYNDSKATTPQAALAALHSVGGPVWLLLGGVDKGGRFDELLQAAAALARGVACYGEAGPALAELLGAQRSACPVGCVNTLVQAAQWCWRQSEPGDAITLSPACASFDQFRNYEHRGRAFRELVAQLKKPA